MKLFPQTVSVQDVQRRYRAIAKQVNESGQPVIVLNHGRPDLVLIGMAELERLYAEAEKNRKTDKSRFKMTIIERD